MTKVYVAGVGMTSTGRQPGSSVRSLACDAITAALADCGLGASAIETVYFSGVTQGHLEGQTMIGGQIVMRAMGIGGVPVINVENACASGATALMLAAQAIRSGEVDCTLAVGAEKMFIADKQRMFSLFEGGWDVSNVESTVARLKKLGEGIDPPPGTTSDKPYSVFMDVYSAICRHHMMKWGTTQEQMAAVSSKNHIHSQHNPLAQFQQPYSIEEILAAPPIVYPLTLPMCAPLSDGAAATILVSEKTAARLGIARDRMVEIRASVLASGIDRQPDDYRNHITARLAERAWRTAGIGPEDVSVAEVHDATAFGEIIQSENLGFFAFGDGGPAAVRGDTRIGGRLPINPSGGLQSKGHPIGATGLGQIHELVTQLRGEAGLRQVEGARVAVAENGGGMLGYEEAAAVITVLAR